jgi:hypothetical protein
VDIADSDEHAGAGGGGAELDPSDWLTGDDDSIAAFLQGACRRTAADPEDGADRCDVGGEAELADGLGCPPDRLVQSRIDIENWAFEVAGGVAMRLVPYVSAVPIAHHKPNVGM